MISDSYSLEVPFFDVDSMQIVWHGHYCKYLELARCQLLEKVGYSYHDMKTTGFMFPIVDMRIKYIKPLLFGQVIDIVSTLKEWENRLKIEYLIKDKKTQETLTNAHTIQAAVDMETQIMKFVCPQVFIDRVNALL